MSETLSRKLANLLQRLQYSMYRWMCESTPLVKQRVAGSATCAGAGCRVIFTGLLLVLAFEYFPAKMNCQTPNASAGSTNNGPALQRRSIESSQAVNSEYVIGADDVLRVYVVDVPQFTGDYRVGPDGSLTIPLLPSPVRAKGLTLDQLSELISDKLRAAELVSHPHVVVSVKTSPAHAVAITGAVEHPQIYPTFAPTTLLDVLSQAGGLAPDAGTTAIITRDNRSPLASWPVKGSAPAEGTIKVDLQKLLASGDPSLNVTIYPGDKITVQCAGIIYVVGAVGRPGGFRLSNGRDRMTVLQAVALGEGLKATALQKKAMIIRRGPQFPTGREEIPVNLKEILAGRAPDPSLEANDILFIPDSASKRALRRGAEAAVQIATDIVIWNRY
jgi:polysaccharide export outer membrane protein